MSNERKKKKVRKQSMNQEKVVSCVTQKRKQKIYGVISKWCEVLQGVSHNEPLKRVVTRNGQSFSPPVSHPRLFLTFNDVIQSKGYTLEWGIFPYMETSLPKSNTGTHGLRNEFCTLSGWDRQFGRFRLNPKILEFLRYFMKNMGQFFLKMELFKKFWDMWAPDSQTGVLIQVSTVSEFPFSHTVISFALSGRELL